MNTPEQLARMTEWLDANRVAFSVPRNPTADLDEATLRRSRHTLTTPDTYRRRADQPAETWADETAVADGSVRASEVER